MVIDRIEGEFAIIEFEGKTMDIPTCLLPKEAREGDRLQFVIERDDGQGQAAQERLARLQDQDQLPDHIDL